GFFFFFFFFQCIFFFFFEETKSRLLQMASEKIAPLQDAVDLDEATDKEKASLLAWKKYRVQVNRVDTSIPTWPGIPS
ncbi:hypothetical protein K792_22512, partial [Salmonella enterica subsp. enterica serovar Newport str. SHSN002]|uniref:tail fiber assembly protein n=1 Tax=Salmonella enterica TaxID=28901 RepID=UPI000A1851F3